MEDSILKVNALAAANGVGAILSTVFGCTVLGLATSHARTPPWALPCAFVLFGLATILLLARKIVELDLQQRLGRIGRGIWPFVLWRAIRVGGTAEFRVEGVRGNYGWQINVGLSGLESGSTIPLVRRGGEMETEPVLRWARRLGIPIVADSNLLRAPEDTMRRILPELFDRS